MSVRVKPCYMCPLRKNCDLKTDFVKRVSGLGLRSATFTCPILTAEIRLGRRIKIRGFCMEIGGYNSDAPIIVPMILRATISGGCGKDHRFSAVVDPGQIEPDDVALFTGGDDPDGTAERIRFRKSMSHIRIIEFLDEADGVFCSSGCLVRDGKCDMHPNSRAEPDWSDGHRLAFNE